MHTQRKEHVKDSEVLTLVVGSYRIVSFFNLFFCLLVFANGGEERKGN